MKHFVVALPIFTGDMAVDSYRLVYSSTTNLFGTEQGYLALDGVMCSPGLDTLNSTGLDPFTGGKPIFIEVNRYLLLAGVSQSCKIPAEKVICILSKDIPFEDMYMDKCRELKTIGFKIALDGIDHNSESGPLYKMADYFVADYSEDNLVASLRVLRIQYPALKVLITNVKEKKKFEAIKSIPNALFSGNFYTEPLTEGVSKVDPIKANAINLLRTVSDEDFDLSNVSQVVGQDVALTVALLKFINSPAVGVTSKVNSIKAAIALLGQKETRKWVTAAVSVYLAQDLPNEITRLSLIRAKFAENLATTFNLGIHAPSLFIMGLFSILDVILEKPMEAAVDSVHITDVVKAALVRREGEFAPVLDLIYSYEQADWREVSCIVIVNGLNANSICQSFEDALMWYKSIIEYIT